jgi:hypothetical protein
MTASEGEAMLQMTGREAALMLHALRQYANWKGYEVSENTAALIGKLDTYLSTCGQQS